MPVSLAYQLEKRPAFLSQNLPTSKMFNAHKGSAQRHFCAKLTTCQNIRSF